MFAKTYSYELSTAVVLTVPTQESWKVSLIKEGYKLWFCDGWQEFVEYYSIGFAYFLLFEYEGNSKFEVHIFDTTACEISYLYNARSSPQDQEESCDDHQSQERFLQKKPHVDSSISVETSEVIKLESEDETSLHKHDEQIHDYNIDDVSSGFSDSSLATDDEELDLYEESEHGTDANSVQRGNQSVAEDLWSKHKEALALAGLAKPKTPFFITVIKERHLRRTPFVYVPAHFGPYLRHQAGKLVQLEASDRGGQWAVRYTAGGGRYNLGSGWIVFARNNNLKAGDVCVFQLIDANNYILKVHVVRKSRI